jgi:hypothetical protein
VQRPLTTVVIGGLVTCTRLTLLVPPAIYGWFESREDEEAHAAWHDEAVWVEHAGSARLLPDASVCSEEG